MQYAYIYACVVYVWLGVIIRRGDEVLGRTMRRAVMDSLTHLFSSRRWPATWHTHSTAVNTQMDTTVPLLPPPVPPPTTTASDHHHHHAILAFPSLLLLLLSSRFFVSSSLSLLRVSLRWSGVTGDFGARRGRRWRTWRACQGELAASDGATSMGMHGIYADAGMLILVFMLGAQRADVLQTCSAHLTDRYILQRQRVNASRTLLFLFFYKNYGLCFRRRIFGSIGR